VIKAIHGVDGGLGRRPTTGARSCWSSIVQKVKNLRIQGSALKDMFPRLFALENVKSVTVYKKLNDSSLDYSMQDRFVCCLENSGDFSVKSIRKRIDDTRFIGGEIGTRWIKSVPIKVNIMAWKIQSDALPTRFNISRRVLRMEKKNMKALLRVVVDCNEHSFYIIFFLSSARVLSTTSRIFDCFRNANVNYFPSNTVVHADAVTQELFSSRLGLQSGSTPHGDMMQDAVTQELFSSRLGLQSGSTPHGDISRTSVCQSALPALNYAYLCLDSDGCVIRPEVISFPNRTKETRHQRHLPAEYLGDPAQIAQHEEASSSF
nr:RNA-directed DNA polymerase, eukaryota [Tanacetum cinerariifolium]